MSLLADLNGVLLSVERAIVDAVLPTSAASSPSHNDRQTPAELVAASYDEFYAGQRAPLPDGTVEDSRRDHLQVDAPSDPGSVQ